MPKTILIQDPDVLISLDLAQTVMEAWPDANVILCREAEQIFGMLPPGQVPDMVILRQSMRSARAAGLADLIAKPHVKVLLTGADDDEALIIAAAGWRALDMPFSAKQVHAALQDDCPERERRLESHCKALFIG